jgi:hypothetical protein
MDPRGSVTLCMPRSEQLAALELLLRQGLPRTLRGRHGARSTATASTPHSGVRILPSLLPGNRSPPTVVDSDRASPHPGWPRARSPRSAAWPAAARPGRDEVRRRLPGVLAVALPLVEVVELLHSRDQERPRVPVEVLELLLRVHQPPRVQHGRQRQCRREGRAPTVSPCSSCCEACSSVRADGQAAPEQAGKRQQRACHQSATLAARTPRRICHHPPGLRPERAALPCPTGWAGRAPGPSLPGRGGCAR